MPKILIRCPKCYWEPDKSCKWQCSDCKMVWDTFTTRGKCPGCGRVYETTSCLRKRGGCGEASPHEDWYEEVKSETKPGLFGFWKSKVTLPVTPGDKKWTEDSLLALVELFTTEVFKSFSTIVPADFEHQFSGTEEDAEYILRRLLLIMNIDGWEIRLMYFSNGPVELSDGTVATPSDNLAGNWSSPTGEYVDNGLGNREIWIEERQLKQSESLVATLAHQLATYKLASDNDHKEAVLADLMAIVYGLGVFMGNSYFRFSRWRTTSRQGWDMQRKGYLPEQITAYAMAWLAHYRNEDIAWASAFNKTMRKHFDQCYKYIAENKDKVRWG